MTTDRRSHKLWPHQQRALAAFGDSLAAGAASTYLVVPPGGKTLIGLEAARRLGRPTLVLCPNTAIQAQWIAQWQDAFTPLLPRPAALGANRKLAETFARAWHARVSPWHGSRPALPAISRHLADEPGCLRQRAVGGSDHAGL